MDEPIPLSALQHYLYCPRQCALIHVERLWTENRYTAEGRLLHDKADRPGVQTRKGVRTVTAMPLASEKLGLTGVADVVEFHPKEQGEAAYPVEYKRGQPKQHRADEVQLCAQAMCLEEMFNQDIAEGALFYGKTRRRKSIVFDDALRTLVQQTVAATRALIDGGCTPSTCYEAKRCDACSLIDDCQPGLLAPGHSVAAWLAHMLDLDAKD